MVGPHLGDVGGVPEVAEVAPGLAVVPGPGVQLLRQREVHDVGSGLLHTLNQRRYLYLYL